MIQMENFGNTLCNQRMGDILFFVSLSCTDANGFHENGVHFKQRFGFEMFCYNVLETCKTSSFNANSTHKFAQASPHSAMHFSIGHQHQGMVSFGTTIHDSIFCKDLSPCSSSGELSEISIISKPCIFQNYILKTYVNWNLLLEDCTQKCFKKHTSAFHALLKTQEPYTLFKTHSHELCCQEPGLVIFQKSRRDPKFARKEAGKKIRGGTITGIFHQVILVIWRVRFKIRRISKQFVAKSQHRSRGKMNAQQWRCDSNKSWMFAVEAMHEAWYIRNRKMSWMGWIPL